MEKHKQRLQEIKNLLESDAIDLSKLREFCSQGCPNEGGVRALVWKILLGYLPLKRNFWERDLLQQRNAYREFVRDMIIRPGYKEKDELGEDEEAPQIIDHPLNSNPKSEWSSYFKDNEVLVQIDKDVRRLCPDLFFFQKATEFPCTEIKNAANAERYQSLRKRVAFTQLKADEVSKNRLGITNYKADAKKSSVLDEEQSEYAHLPDGQEAHWEIVERILFIFAKLNPGQSYVQGMNEICGPIYYTFATDPDIEWRKHAEADAFFCFTKLMGIQGIRDNFLPFLDNTEFGIGSNMKRLFELIKSKDVSVYQVLEKQNLKPEYFAFRWLTLLLSQEFSLPDVIALWDVLFADKNLLDLLMHVCCAMVLMQKENLLKGDFSTNIKILQNYPQTDIQTIIRKSFSIRK